MPTTQSSSPAAAAGKRSPVILLGVAFLAILLTVYQWMELAQLRSGGGDALLCSFSATFDCAAVWDSALASGVHEATGIPIVGWGLTWSVIAFVLAGTLLYQMGKASPSGNVVLALRLTTGIGALVSLLLLTYSAVIGIFCPSCMAFYVLVAIATYLAFMRIKTSDRVWLQPAMLSGGLLAVILALLIYPGLNTPRENLLTANITTVSDQAAAERDELANTSTGLPESPLAEFLNSLQIQVQQVTSDSLAVYRRSQPVEPVADPERTVVGTATAPVHVIDWSDILCPHCKNLHANLQDMHSITAPTDWSHEVRHYPLDSQCNPGIQRSGGGVSCLAAKVQIALRDSPDFDRVRSTMFEEQQTLTKERIWEIATQNVDREELEVHVDSPETQQILEDDIELAEQHNITGTPMVVINGRMTTAAPALIYALILAKGRDDHPDFLELPPPNPLLGG